MNPIYEAYIMINEGSFYRLPSHVIGNELYEFKKAVEAFYSS